MARQIFLNIPVKDLNKSVAFFTKLGFKFNPQFTDENATCMIITEDSFVMLLVEKFFKSFTTKEICDTSKYAEAIVSIGVESKEQADEMAKNATDAGATNSETQDHGWMYQRNFQDPDGHKWEIFYMDISKMPKK